MPYICKKSMVIVLVMLQSIVQLYACLVTTAYCLAALFLRCNLRR